MKRLLIFAILLAIFGYPVCRAEAHGGGEIQIANAPAGPYKVTIWLNPPQPQAAETIHVTVGLAAMTDDRPILDAAVQVQVTAVADRQQVLSTPATTEASVNKLFYETDFVIDEVGEYEVSVNVTGPDGSGNTAFQMTIAPARPMNWLAMGLTALVLVVAATLYRNRKTDRVGEAPPNRRPNR